MKRPVLWLVIVLVVGAVAWFAWTRISPPPAPPVAAQPAHPAEPVVLGGLNEKFTVDFSSGTPVVTNTPEDKAAIEDAVQDMAAATKSVTFEPPKRKPVPVRPTGPVKPAAPVKSAEPVELGGPNEHKTIDFSSGQAVVKDTPEDKAVIDAAVRDMAAAKKGIIFEPTKKKPAVPVKP